MFKEKPKKHNGTAHEKVKNAPKGVRLHGLNSRNLGYIMISVLVLALCVGYISGLNQWTVKYIACGGAPVAITHTIASPLSERLYPGDKSYGPDFYNSYECMTAEEKAGKRY